MKTCPSSKKRYDTEQEGLYDARDGMLFRGSPELKVYFCLICSGYHLTSRIDTKKVKRRSKK